VRIDCGLFLNGFFERYNDAQNQYNRDLDVGLLKQASLGLLNISVDI